MMTVVNFPEHFWSNACGTKGCKSAVQALPTIGFAKQALLPRAEYD
jgi:hypothetical protein